MRKAAVVILSFAVFCCVLVFASAVQRRPVVPSPEKSRLPGQVHISPEQHKAVTRRVFDDLFNRGRYEAISEIYTRDCVVHHNNKTTSLDAAVSEGKGWRSAAPDLQMTPDEMSVDGDIVSVSWTAKGTHTGKGNGLVRPTGKRILVHGTSRFRIVDGKIAEVWNNYDRNEIFRQLGVSPTMAFLYDKTEDVQLAFNRIFSGDPSQSLPAR
jgi:predicted ester cyclase